MPYKYHSQHQAEAFANAIIPVPEDYPLPEGVPGSFIENFACLFQLAKDIYLDMAKEPEAYGVMLLDINEPDHNKARDSYRTIHRFGDTLSALFLSGEVKNNCLTIDVKTFKNLIKKIPKYGLILSRLCDFGFEISHFNGNTINKEADTFTVEYPDNPELIDTVKIYCDRWNVIRQTHQGNIKARKNKDNLIRVAPENFMHHFYRFDYKSTADLSKIDMLTWVNDMAVYECYSEQLKAFNEAFYLKSLEYANVHFNGDYNYKSKRIARITQVEYEALGKNRFELSLKISKPDECMDVINTLPDSIKELFSKDYCHYCGGKDSSEGCSMRYKWTFEGSPRVGCPCQCFNTSDFNVSLVPEYWRLLEAFYCLKKNQ